MYNLDESTPNQWNVSSNNKAIRDTYNYFSTNDGIWRTLSGGPNGTFDFSFLADVPLAGDYNGDGIVNAGDYTLWRDSFGQVGSSLAADGNRDTMVDELDYVVWKNNFGSTITLNGGAASIRAPEPSAAIVLCMGIALGIATMRLRPV